LARIAWVTVRACALQAAISSRFTSRDSGGRCAVPYRRRMLPQN